MKETIIVKDLKKTFLLSRKQMKIDKTNSNVKVAVDGISFTTYSGEIYGCHAFNNGGAIYLTNNAQLNINGGNIMLNRAVSEGAGVYVNNSKVFLNGGTIKYNTLSSSVGFDTPSKNKTENTNNIDLTVGIIFAVICVVTAVSIVFIVKNKRHKFNKKFKK